MGSAFYAQENPSTTKDSVLVEQIDEVILTATRTNRQLSSVPLAAQLIGKREIQNINSVRLDDLLNEQTGLITVPDFGGGEGLQLQGLDSQYVLVMIDGTPLVGRSAGTLDLSRLSVGNIKQIEVVKGASSSLYGSEALGGVVNIITETPRYGWQGEINQRNSSFNSLDSRLDLGYRNDKFSISAFVNRNSSDGYDLNEDDDLNTVEPFTNYTVSSKMKYEISENTQLNSSLRYFSSIQDYVLSDNMSGESKIDEWNALLKGNHEFNEKWRSEAEFYFTNYKANSFLEDDFGNSVEDSNFDQRFIRPEIRTIFQKDENTEAIFGAGLTHESLERTDFSEDPVFNSPYLYAQIDKQFTDNFNLILGARFDAHNEYKSQFSPKASALYKFNEKLKMKSSVGYGFKAPDFRQLYFNFSNATVGYTVLGYNAVIEVIQELDDRGEINNIVVPLSEYEGGLSPENSISVNLGIDFRPNNKWKFELNLFRNDVDDLIDTRVIASKTNGQNVFSYYNVSKVYTQGLEFNSNWNINKKLSISAGYQLLYAFDKEAKEAFENGEVFARENPSSPAFQLDKDDYFGLYNRSRHMANFKVFYKIPNWDLDANFRGTYRSKYGLTDTNSNNYLDRYDEFVDGYAIWDFAINKTIYDNYRLSVGMDNMFDFTDPQNISNIPGRIIYGQLNITF